MLTVAHIFRCLEVRAALGETDFPVPRDRLSPRHYLVKELERKNYANLTEPAFLVQEDNNSAHNYLEMAMREYDSLGPMNVEPIVFSEIIERKIR